MNDLRKATLTTLEVAEMMETEHWKLLRRLEGRAGRDGQHERGYVEILTDNHLVVSDYFLPSTYRDTSGKENKCYEVTRLGCDFLANKSTGEKGVTFTARYVKRFYEMENRERTAAQLDGATLNGLARTGNLIRNTMKDEGAAPYEIAEVMDSFFRQGGLVLPKQFVKVPDFSQLDVNEYRRRAY